MKTILILLITICIATTTHAQSLLDIYKSGTIKLVAEPEFGKTNNWEDIFRDRNQKYLKLMPDGSFLINHTYQKYFTKFFANGKFDKEFNIKSSSGKVLKTPGIGGFLEDRTMYTGIATDGTMYICDMEGKLIRTLDFDYLARKIIPLPNNKLAISGSVLWKDRFRYTVAITDYETGEEEVIWDSFSPRSSVQILRIDDSSTQTFVPPPPPPKVTGSKPNIVLTAKNELLVCIPSTGELIFYDLNGNKLRTKKVNWKNDQVPVNELLQKHDEIRDKIANREITERMKERFGGEEGAKKYIEEMLKHHDANRELITSPKDLPYYSTIIEDSDNNLLFFEYAKEKGDNKFNVYALNGEGEFICQSSFVCDDYDLVINPGRLIFKDGYLYGLQELKETSGIPMRFVRFKLETIN